MWVRGGGALFRATKCQGLTSVKAKLCFFFFFFFWCWDIYRGLSLRCTASETQGNVGLFPARVSETWRVHFSAMGDKLETCDLPIL